jgi:hypothetical protein
MDDSISGLQKKIEGKTKGRLWCTGKFLRKLLKAIIKDRPKFDHTIFTETQGDNGRFITMGGNPLYSIRNSALIKRKYASSAATIVI